MSIATTLVEVDNLKVHFQSRKGFFSRRNDVVAAVDGVTFKVAAGEAFGLVGESGCGKSTLGRAILRLGEITSGRVAFDGVDLLSMKQEALRRLRKRMQIILQDPYASLDPKMTVEEILSEPIVTHSLASGSERSDLVEEFLRVVGLDPRRKHQYPHEFSGGQRQRINIARALTVRPDFLVCDEATSALDVSIRAQILNLLVDLRRRYGLAFLFISHDLGVVRHMSDRIGVMYLGQLVEIGPVGKVYEQPLHPYTQALLSAVPVPDPAIERTRRRVLLSGDLPDPSSPPTGCRFHSRCWLSERLNRPARCSAEAPVLVENNNGHLVACHFVDEAIQHRPETPSVPGTPRRIIRQRAEMPGQALSGDNRLA